MYLPQLRKVIASYPEPERSLAQAYLDAHDHYKRLLRERYPDLEPPQGGDE